MSPLVPPDLIQTGPPADALLRAEQLCQEAREAVVHATATIEQSKKQRRERRQWHGLWMTLWAAAPDYLLVRCACCTRLRTVDGDWMEWPAQTIQDRKLEISHGLCPECLAKLWLTVSTPADVVLATG